MEYRIDADNKILGRVAVEAANLLRGKNHPSFDPQKIGTNRVTITNTDKIRVTGTKLTTKLYRRHSGYPGGLREERLGDILAHDSRRAIRMAVLGMLPKNKLRSRVIRHLVLLKGSDR